MRRRELLTTAIAAAAAASVPAVVEAALPADVPVPVPSSQPWLCCDYSLNEGMVSLYNMVAAVPTIEGYPRLALYRTDRHGDGLNWETTLVATVPLSDLHCGWDRFIDYVDEEVLQGLNLKPERRYKILVAAGRLTVEQDFSYNTVKLELAPGYVLYRHPGPILTPLGRTDPPIQLQPKDEISFDFKFIVEDTGTCTDYGSWQAFKGGKVVYDSCWIALRYHKDNEPPEDPEDNVYFSEDFKLLERADRAHLSLPRGNRVRQSSATVYGDRSVARSSYILNDWSESNSVHVLPKAMVKGEFKLLPATGTVQHSEKG